MNVFCHQTCFSILKSSCWSRFVDVFCHQFCFVKATRLTSYECFLSSDLFFYIEVIMLVKVCGCFLSSVLFCEGHQANQLWMFSVISFVFMEVIMLGKVCGCFMSSALDYFAVSHPVLVSLSCLILSWCSCVEWRWNWMSWWIGCMPGLCSLSVSLLLSVLKVQLSRKSAFKWHENELYPGQDSLPNFEHSEWKEHFFFLFFYQGSK